MRRQKRGKQAFRHVNEYRCFSKDPNIAKVNRTTDSLAAQMQGSCELGRHGLPNLNNLRTVHFTRNSNIARFLHEYDYVQEFGEGIDRMFNEMAAAGFPAPEYRDNAFMLNATIRNRVISETDEVIIGKL